MAFQFSNQQRRLFFASKGCVGAAASEVRKGDRVCVLLGCNVPLAVRSEGDHYLVVGGTYVYGMMNGEVMQDVKEGKLKEECLMFK